MSVFFKLAGYCAGSIIQGKWAIVCREHFFKVAGYCVQGAFFKVVGYCVKGAFFKIVQGAFFKVVGYCGGSLIQNPVQSRIQN